MVAEQDIAIEKQKRDKLEQEKESAIRSIVENVFPSFAANMKLTKDICWLNAESLVCAISDAFSDIERVGNYHSKTGANRFKKAAYLGKWIAEAKPIQVASNFSVIIVDGVTLNSIMLNAIFAVCVVEFFLGEEYIMYKKLRLDLRYIFVFRHRVEAISIAMLLEHALKYSKN